MPELDYGKILNENPAKRLRIMHENLKQDFSEDLAKEYSNIYMEQPLPFLLENSRYIFSEPVYGCQYYREQVLDKKHVLECVSQYPEELEKVEAFVEEFGSKMSETQKEMYESLVTELRAQTEGTRNLRTMVAYENELPAGDNVMRFLTETPFHIMNGETDTATCLESVNALAELCTESSEDPEKWKLIFEAVVTCGKLMEDSVFESVVNDHTIPRDYRNFVRALAKESVDNQIKSIYQVHDRENYIREYSTPEMAVDTIFDLMDTQDLFEEMYQEERDTVDNLCGFAYDLLSGIAAFEYTLVEDTTTEFQGFRGVFTEATSVEDALRYLTLKYDEYVVEAKGNDNEEPGQPSETVRKSAGSYGEEEEPSRKKPEPPSTSSAARKIQNKWMDKEAKYYKRAAKVKATGEDIKGAAKAVASIPVNIKGNIDSAIAEWDAMDDERRRKYIVKPGFRKKIFRNLKLAIIYGATTSMSLLMLPVTMMVRHYSKQKDRRIRNQLAKELQTEIDICKEKINDASSKSDDKKKYQLMRIKSKLEQEYARVLSNSKYI